MSRYPHIRRSPWADEGALPAAAGLSSLTKSFNAALGVVSPAQLEQVLSSLDAPQSAALQTKLRRVGNFVTLEGLARSAELIRPLLSHEHPLCLPRTGSAADCLDYLVNRKYMLGSDRLIPVQRGLVQNGRLLLDAATLTRLEQDKAFAKLALTRNIRLVYVPRLNEGLETAFGHTPESLAVAAKSAAPDTAQLGKSLRDESEEITARLQGISLTHALPESLARRFTLTTASADINTDDLAELAATLSPHPGIREDQLVAWRERLPKGLGRAMLELFVTNSKILALPDLMGQMRTLRSGIEAFNTNTAKASPGNTWLFLPDDGNSAQLTALLSSLTASDALLLKPIGPGAITQVTRSGASNEPKLVVLLDDVALTGDTLARQHAWLRKQCAGTSTAIFIGTLASATQARSRFAELARSDKSLGFSGGASVPVLSESSLSERTDSETQRALAVLSQYAGYGGLGTMLVLPYGAPNNNHLFFNQTIAPLLTLRGAGVRHVAGMGKKDGQERSRIISDLERRAQNPD